MVKARLHEGNRTFHFASVDGESFVGISRPPTKSEQEDVRRIIDGDGRYKPLQIHRRLLQQRGASFETI